MTDEVLDLGPCCACEATEGVRNILTLERLAPEPGTGWGCVVCNLPGNGAVAVLCDACMEAGREPRFVVSGYLESGKRARIEDLPPGDVTHDMAMHEAYEARHGRLEDPL